ncbi:MAG: DNA repair protein RecO [Clostridia bacterium]|nr:DNA repair protein RecO [Clostridia bacterium]
MASDPVNLRGVVLKSRDFKDKDKIVSFLSSDSGVIDICVKGSSKTGSKLAAITIPFVVADVVITTSGGFYYLKDYSIVESNSNIMTSLEAMTVATHFSNLLSTSYIDATNSSEFYKLVVYSLYYLSQFPQRYLNAYSAFNWRFLDMLGFVVKYENCISCHKNIDMGDFYLSYKTGEVYCSECFKKSNINTYDYVKLSFEAVLALNHYSEANYNQLFSFKNSIETLNGLVDFTTKYLSHQLETEFDSLQKLKALIDMYKI